jgi:molybdopterin-guanine dinucleotide biosynthesis protein A
VRGIGFEVVLVGRRPDYDVLGLRSLEDTPVGMGPIGGLRALLQAAGGAQAIALGCDMPYLSLALLRALRDAAPAPIVAARRQERWEPFFARFDAELMLSAVDAHIAQGLRSLQALFDHVGAVELVLPPQLASELDDWDYPSDVGRS